MIDHPQIPPEHAKAEAGAKRLRASLLGGETARVARRSIGSPLAFTALDICKYPIEKAVSKALDDLLDAADVDQIAADAEDHRARSRCWNPFRLCTGTPGRPDTSNRRAGVSRGLFRPS